MLDVLTIRLYLLSKPVTPDSPGRSGRPPYARRLITERHPHTTWGNPS